MQFLKKSKIPAYAPLGGLLEDAYAGILDFFKNCAQDLRCNVFGCFQLSSIFFKKMPWNIFFSIFQKLFWTDNQIVIFLFFCIFVKFWNLLLKVKEFRFFEKKIVPLKSGIPHNFCPFPHFFLKKIENFFPSFLNKWACNFLFYFFHNCALKS